MKISQIICNHQNILQQVMQSWNIASRNFNCILLAAIAFYSRLGKTAWEKMFRITFVYILITDAH